MASRSSIDLSRRRVAAISLLANISTDDTVTGIRHGCLQVWGLLGPKDA